MRGRRPRLRVVTSAWLAVACCFGARAAIAAVAAVPAPLTPAQELIAAQDAASRLTILVMVNEQGPYPFVIDTGADRTVISRELAATLNLPAGPHAALHDTAGVQEVATAVIDHLAFGGREVTGINAPTLAASNLGAAGMLGIDSLRNQNVVMDFHAQTFRLGPSSLEPDRFDPHVIVVEGRRRFGQLILVDSQSRGRPVFVILDSGAQSTVGNTALQDLIAVDRQKHTGTPSPTEIISVTGRKTPVEVNDISEISLGPILIKHVPIAFANLHTFAHLGLADRPAMLLGMDVLRHFHQVSVDFLRRQAVFVTE